MKCGGIASVQAGPAPLAVGVDLARRVGEGRGPFAWVVTSPRPRYIETAVAMGFAVDDEVTALAGPAGLGETFL